MNLRLIRRVSIWLIAMLAFAQASVAIAACSMERGSLAPMLEMADGCGDCEAQDPQYAIAHPTCNCRALLPCLPFIRRTCPFSCSRAPRCTACLVLSLGFHRAARYLFASSCIPS